MRICHQRQVRGGGRVRWAGNKRRGAASAESSATSASRRALQRHRGRDASRDELHQAGRSWRESGTCGYVAEDAQLIGPIRTGVNRRSRGGLTLGSPLEERFKKGTHPRGGFTGFRADPCAGRGGHGGEWFGRSLVRAGSKEVQVVHWRAARGGEGAAGPRGGRARHEAHGGRPRGFS